MLLDDAVDLLPVGLYAQGLLLGKGAGHQSRASAASWRIASIGSSRMACSNTKIKACSLASLLVIVMTSQTKIKKAHRFHGEPSRCSLRTQDCVFKLHRGTARGGPLWSHYTTLWGRSQLICADDFNFIRRQARLLHDHPLDDEGVGLLTAPASTTLHSWAVM
mgnify:CR=1 FL=1